MKQEKFSMKALKTLLMKRKIATMQELKDKLGTQVDMTVLRKLKELAYITSYSNSGKYYALKQTAKFDENGLWSYKQVYFSICDTLIATVESFAVNSERGFSKKELELVLSVRVQEQLFQLYKQDRIQRQRIENVYVYFSIEAEKFRCQRLMRHEHMVSFPINHKVYEEVLGHELKAAIILFFSVLDEAQRRLYAGLESMKVGHGGDKIISDLLSIDPHTVSKGRKELLDQDIEADSIRKQGGGRKSIKKKPQ